LEPFLVTRSDALATGIAVDFWISSVHASVPPLLSRSGLQSAKRGTEMETAKIVLANQTAEDPGALFSVHSKRVPPGSAEGLMKLFNPGHEIRAKYRFRLISD
jgi:hypothetical protein